LFSNRKGAGLSHKKRLDCRTKRDRTAALSFRKLQSAALSLYPSGTYYYNLFCLFLCLKKDQFKEFRENQDYKDFPALSLLLTLLRGREIGELDSFSCPQLASGAASGQGNWRVR